MLCDVDIDFNADSHAVKLVHVGPIVYGARSRLQSDMNGIGWLAPHFEAVWVTDAITDDMLPSMYYIDEDSETTLDERSCRNAVDLEKLRREIPFNNDVLSCHSMRGEYGPPFDGRAFRRLLLLFGDEIFRNREAGQP